MGKRHVLVTYATKHGSTGEIATVIADALREHDLDIELWPAAEVTTVDPYDAVVLGSAVYRTRWQQDAERFVQRFETELTTRSVWLFSSGPLGTEPTDAQGQDLAAAAEPKEIAEFGEAIAPRGHRVFFGVLDPGRLGLGERALRKLPAARAILPEGDFRDWAQIEAWASGIARDLALGSEPAGSALGAEEQQVRHGRAPGAAT